MLGVTLKDPGVGGFAAVVQLVQGPGGKFPHQIAHEVETADVEEEDQFDADPQQQVIELELGGNTWALHLDGDRRAIFQRGPVNLAYGSRGERLKVEGLVDIARGAL